MWYTTRQEGFDDPRHSKRGPQLLISYLFNSLFRLGVALEVISYVAFSILYVSYGGKGLFGFDLAGLPAESRADQTFRNLNAVFCLVYLCGALYILLFQALLADDTCWARGYRAGSKILRLASFLDLLSALLQFIFSLFIAKFYTQKWFGHFQDGGSEWVYFSYTRIIHSLSFILYGIAFYLLEVYHDEGAGDLHAYVNFFLMSLAGIAEFISMFFNASSVATPLIFAAILGVFIWVYFFEPEVNLVSPALYETELTNDVEIQVEKFARMSPFQQTEHNYSEKGEPLLSLGQQNEMIDMHR